MKIIPPIDSSMVQLAERQKRVTVEPQSASGTAASSGARVSVSPAARTAAVLAAAGHYGRTGEAAVVEEIVGTGSPNGEFKEQVVGMLVGMLSRTHAQQQAERAEELAERASKAEDAERAAAAVQDPGGGVSPDTETGASGRLDAAAALSMPGGLEATAAAIALGLDEIASTADSASAELGQTASVATDDE